MRYSDSVGWWILNISSKCLKSMKFILNFRMTSKLRSAESGGGA